MYQNRAAAHERLDQLEEATKDCDISIKHNNKYGKALDRRAKLHKKRAALLEGGGKMEDFIMHLKQAMEDVSMAAQIDGFKHEQLLFVDETLKLLGSSLAILAAKNRPPLLPSSHTIMQYFTSFMDDPLFDTEEDDSPYSKAQAAYRAGNFGDIIGLGEQEVEAGGEHIVRARLLKATFLILTKQLLPALEELTVVLDTAGEDTKARVNALVKRGALYIQRCQDPAQAANDDAAITKVIENFKDAISTFPDCVECYALYAKVLQEKFDFEGADAMYKKGVELNPANANLLVHRALLGLQLTKDVDAAQQGVETALAVDDKCEFAYETLGQIYIQKDNMEKAVEAFDKAIPLVNTELEMAHLFGLRESAMAKAAARRKLAELPTGMQDMGLD